ncbi:MAG TPA: hypothetical protein VF942_17705 [Acidimicrobiales bacterium]
MDGGDHGHGLAILGLQAGEQVRFRRDSNQRWRFGMVIRREHDGSIGLTDGQGASRSVEVAKIEVRCRGPRGGRSWEPLTTRASRTEQLRLPV